MSNPDLIVKRHLKAAQTILIIGHQGPDPDAVCSVLLTKGFVHAQYSHKSITCALDGQWSSYAEGLVGIESLQNIDPYLLVQKNTYDLVILVDANDPRRFSRKNSEALAEWITKHADKVVCIDHHEPVEASQKYAATYNIQASNCSEEVFHTFHTLGFPIFSGAYELVMLGILSDTRRFSNPNNFPQRTFSIINLAIASGVSIEKIVKRLQQYSILELEVAANLMQSTKSMSTYNLMSIPDATMEELWHRCNEDSVVISTGANIAINEFLKNTKPHHCGIAVYKDMQNEGLYKGSLRSDKDVMDCNAVAKKLGGGGHKTAASFQLEAKNLDDAIAKIDIAVSQR